MNDVNPAASLQLEHLYVREEPARRAHRGAAWKGPTGERLRGLMELYHAIEALRANQGAFAVQFLDADAGASLGVMAKDYAAVAAASRGEPVLLIDTVCDDLDCALLDCVRDDLPLSAAFTPSPDQPGLSRTKLSTSHGMMLDLATSAIQPLLHGLGRTHPIVVLSSPPLDEGPAGAGLARFCDGTILVITAGTTTTATILAARQEIERAGGQIVGIAMNGGQTQLPGWLRRWF